MPPASALRTRVWLIAAALTAAVASSAAAADIGGGPVFYHASDSDHGAWAWGGHLRFPVESLASLELSAAFPTYPAHDDSIRVTPVQATVNIFSNDPSNGALFFLLGAGWYPMRVNGPNPYSQRLFGLHTGAGFLFPLGTNWSVDFSYRYLWTEAFLLSRSYALFGSDYRTRGTMLVFDLNRSF